MTSALTQLCGFVAGVWWVAPIVFILDDQRGSLRYTAGNLLGAAAIAVEDFENSGDLVTQLLRIALAFVFLVAYYGFAAFGPTVTALRVALGYPGIRFPGRKVVILNRNTSVVRFCALAIIAISVPIGKTGERRVTELHEAERAVDAFRRSLSSLPRLESGPRGGRRRRQRAVRCHVQRVSVLLEEVEEKLGNASDQEIRESGALLLEMSTRLADRRYRSLLDEERIQHVVIPERGAIRLALGALLVLLLSGVSMFLLSQFGLSDGLEAVAIGVSIVVSAVIVFRGEAMGKLEALGIFGGNSDRPRQ
ncbi:hypothetical protein [Streptomyces sp. TRM75563]|uniref:hypothetical protein n=1 Tax=Streptomyces sp. TRM75563 TaxID=2817418 RepID=UPI001F60E98E|nr:hypothetical protein [Streptomyces sp. TRM75563]MCI4041650.1 hypothetical protein [Streptomyces sp. TRM75563]